MYVRRNNEARSCDYCCRSSKYYECVLLLLPELSGTCRTILPSVACPALPYFFHIISQMEWFSGSGGGGGGGELLNTKCVFWVSLQRLSETFHIQITILRELSHLYTGLHVMHPLFLSDFKCTRAFLDKFSDDPRIKNFVKIGPVWAELCHADKHDEGNSRSSQISPEWVTGPEQGNPSGRIATFSLWTGMFRDDLGSVSSPLCVWNLKNCM